MDLFCPSSDYIVSERCGHLLGFDRATRKLYGGMKRLVRSVANSWRGVAASYSSHSARRIIFCNSQASSALFVSFNDGADTRELAFKGSTASNFAVTTTVKTSYRCLLRVGVCQLMTKWRPSAIAVQSSLPTRTT